MKSLLLLLPLLLLIFVGCSKVEVNANKYEIKDWAYLEEITDYQKNQNYGSLHSYEKDYFESNTLYSYEYNSGLKWKITNSYKSGNTISLEIRVNSFEVQPASTSSSYCVEVKTKGLK